MARKDEQKSKNSGNGNRVQGFVFGISLEGTEEVVTEGIKAFTHAMTKGGIIVSPPVISKPVLPSPKAAQNPIATDADAVEEVEEAQAELEESLDTDENSETAARPRKPRKFPRPNFLRDLNLTQAKVPLSEFMKSKNPPDMMGKYAVVAVWLKDQFGLNEISIDHIFTAFKHLGWESQLPADVGKPLSNLVHGRHWFEKGKAEKTYAIVWLGESEVAKMGTAEAKQ